MRTGIDMTEGPFEEENHSPRASWKDVVSAWMFVAAIGLLALLL